MSMILPSIQDLLNRRASSLVAAAVAFLTIVVALIMQHGFNLMPCPLCIAQRLIYITLGILLLIEAAVHSKKYLAILSSFLVLATAILGVVTAGRHSWLQHQPKDDIPGCLPSLSYLVDTFPLQDVVTKLFRGSSECAEVQWRFLGLSIPEQSLVIFLAFTCFALTKLFLHASRKPKL